MDSSLTAQIYQTSKSWTDDLPVCKQSGVGSCTNQIYREDGYRQEEHKFEDRSFHCKFDDTSYLYEVFDGHEGCKAVDFCFQRMAAEILLGQLIEKNTDEEVKEVLRQAFISVEKAYLESIYDLLAERTSLQCDIPDGLNSYEAYRKVPEVVECIKKINQDLSSGTAAAVALIYANKLYVANVGNCRVLLCQTDTNSVLKVVQLSVDHDLKNEDELLRLSQMGISIDNLRKCIHLYFTKVYMSNTGLMFLATHLGNQENTRCLGNYLVKGGYKEFDDLKTATQEPIIAEPDIHGGINLDDSCQFLLLMSSGLYKSVEEATGTDQVNKYIAQCVVEQFREQATLTGVAQAVVDRVVRLHHDWYMSNSVNDNCTAKREDITLIVRNFNFCLPNAIKSPTNPTVTFNPSVLMRNFTNIVSSTDSNKTINSNIITTTDTDTSSSDLRSVSDTGLGPDQKIESYVDFSLFYKYVEDARRKGTLPDDILF